MNPLLHLESLDRGDHDRRWPSHPGMLRNTRLTVSQLSNREGEVADLIADGLSNRDIANQLGIALSTVETHISSIFSKLGIESRIALIRLQAGI